MLVLSRRIGEAVHIGNVVVVVSRIKDGQVRLAIEAPKDVLVLRGELVRHDDREPTERAK